MIEPLIRSPNPLPVSASVREASLLVADVEVSRSFYSDVLGLELIPTDAESVWLGAGGFPFLELVEASGPPHPVAAPGLFHLAIVYSSRETLSAALGRVSRFRIPLQGASDHGVSEAVYLADPDGNGLELYRDRPIGEWPTQGNHVAMQTLPLDLARLLGEAGPTDGGIAPPDTRIGHIHLRVSNVAEAETFYREVLGFDLVQRYGDSASFLSAGGYHHHVAVNSWVRTHTQRAPTGAPGLAWFRVHLPRQAQRTLEDRLRRDGVPYARQGADLVLHDPSGIQIVV